MKHIFKFFFAVLFSLAAPEQAPAGSLTLSWYASASTDVIGYDVYYGTNSGNYPYMFNAGNATSATITNLSAGVPYYFAATAYDANNDQSAYSAEISYLVPGILILANNPTSGSPALLQFPVAPGQSYEVQASTDLLNWSSLWQSDVATSNAWMQFTDPDSGSFASRFYRLVLH